MRALLTSPPYLDPHADIPGKRGLWPCRWIACPGVSAPPFVAAYRKRFTLEEETCLRVHVSADERYELFLDGVRWGRGSERGDEGAWFFETYDLALLPGEHCLAARVWSLGPQAAYAQMTVTHGFLLSPEEAEWIARLGTGVAEWESRLLSGYAFTDPDPAWGTGANLVIGGVDYAWDFAEEGDNWQVAEAGETAMSAAADPDLTGVHRLRPATLPPMMDGRWAAGTVRHVAELAVSAVKLETNAIPFRAADNLTPEQDAWQSLLEGRNSVTIPPHTRRRVLVDWSDYVCAYSQLCVSGGAGSRIRLHWQEALYEQLPPQTKGNRDAVEGKYFVCAWWAHDGVGDTFLPDGGPGRLLETLWWQCGRYVEIVAQTADEALTIESLTLQETRYPLEMESRFAASDDRLAQVIPLALRALQMCAHETYMDCPFYEQLQYVGDTRLETLTTYALTWDDRLPRKALTLFDASRLRSGLTQSRYPSRVRQVIPPFSLWWIGMVHDYALWRDDPVFVRGFLPGVRGVLDAFAQNLNPDGLLTAPSGWNYIDWVPGWESGIPPDGAASEGAAGISGPLHWQLVLALKQAAELEDWAQEPELAARCRRLGGALAARAAAAFWDERRGLLADDLGKTHFSEHSQCLAILSGEMPRSQTDRMAQGLESAPDLARTTIYFTHYFFEACYALERPDRLLERMSLWFDLLGRGLRTTVEMPEPTRSDCHAWGAHPLYHYFASLLGIRPAAPGFTHVSIAPQLGPLRWAEGSLPHPHGSIDVGLRREDETLHASIVLPSGISGTFRWAGQVHSLAPGPQHLSLNGNTEE